ncbi:ubiquitin-specific protease ubp1 [Rhodotorula kratochvilovae]
MSHSGYRATPFETYSTPDLHPLLSALSAVLVGSLVVLITASTLLGLAPLAAALESLAQLGEMVSLGVSSLLGKGGLAKLDWEKNDGWGGAGEGDGLAALAGKEAQEKVRRYKDTKEGKARAAGEGQYFPGLLNAAGNLCFLNATLQSMASLPPLITYLDQLVTSALELSLSLPVSTALLDTLEALNTPSSSRPQPLRPVELASALAASSPARHRLLASSEQQDAHELWGMIRDAVEEEAGRLSAAQEQDAARGAGLAEAATLNAGLGIALAKRRGAKGGTDPWFWLQSQRVRCMECGYVRDTRHEPAELLMLQVPAIAQCSLHDLLAEYTKTDLISGYNCRRCAMLATLARLEGQRDRLALVAPPPSSSSSPACAAAAKNPFELPPNTTAEGESKKMTSSRKDRRRKAQKLVDRVKAVVEAADWEKDLGADITMEKSESAAGKVTRFARTPELLMVHLNRSTHYGYSGAIKNSCQVTFPEYLNLAPFCDGASPISAESSSPSSSPLQDVYRLSSLVVHYGSHSFGHYVAFRRRPILDLADTSGLPTSEGGERASTPALPAWFRVSDETVDPSSIYEALRANPFLLFYERVRDDRPREELGTGLGALGSLAGGATARVVESWRAASRGAGARPAGAEGGQGGGEEDAPDAADGGSQAG